MSYVLKIDTSPRGADSHSKELADSIINRVMQLSPELTLQQLDLQQNVIPHISNETIKGFYTPVDSMTNELIAATQLSDTLIEQLCKAEVLIISAPMYNFGVPSCLKAWIDQIVRIHKTFAYDGQTFSGLVPIKRAYLALAYGAQGYAPGGDFAGMNFLEPYLTSLLSFLGIPHTTTFRLEGTTGNPADIQQAKAKVNQLIHQSII